MELNDKQKQGLDIAVDRYKRKERYTVISGYAGTGKTLMVSTLVKVLKKIHREVVLLAPTGRAAKVFTTTAGTTAYTIHKHIYRQRTLTSEESHFDLDRNNNKNAVIIIDE